MVDHPQLLNLIFGFHYGSVEALRFVSRSLGFAIQSTIYPGLVLYLAASLGRQLAAQKALGPYNATIILGFARHWPGRVVHALFVLK